MIAGAWTNPLLAPLPAICLPFAFLPKAPLACAQKQGLGADPEKAMLGSIMHTLRSDGNVLMPVDTAGRVLELILLLEHHWATERWAHQACKLPTLKPYIVPVHGCDQNSSAGAALHEVQLFTVGSHRSGLLCLLMTPNDAVAPNTPSAILPRPVMLQADIPPGAAVPHGPQHFGVCQEPAGVDE